MTQGQEPAGRTLKLDAITHSYGGAAAIESCTLDIAAGELVALLGPSGCGKTTLLRIVAGFVRQTGGRVLVGGVPIDHEPPRARRVGIVFQSYALFPHMSVLDNVAYGLAARGVGRQHRAAEAMRMLELVQLAPLAQRMPRALSGGQQQRVALARALAIQPAILLLDEPFAALDKNLRLDMQIEVKRIQRTAGTTTIMVTHDQEEALSMADRVAVLSRGRLEQFAPPIEVYDHPASLFVQGFVGQVNRLPGRLATASGGLGQVALDCGGTLTARLPAVPLPHGARVIVCLRPEHLQIAPDGIPGVVELGLPLGPTIVHEIRLADGQSVRTVEARRAGAAPRLPGDRIHIAPAAPDSAGLFAEP